MTSSDHYHNLLPWPSIAVIYTIYLKPSFKYQYCLYDLAEGEPDFNEQVWILLLLSPFIDKHILVSISAQGTLGKLSTLGR